MPVAAASGGSTRFPHRSLVTTHVMSGRPEQPPETKASARGTDTSGAARRRPGEPHAGGANLFLQALPRDEYARIQPHLESFAVGPLQVLVEAGEPLDHVYFPESAIVSVIRRLSDGMMVETGTIGREGMAGIAVLLDAAWSSAALMGEVPGRCKRMPADALLELLPSLPTLHGLLRRFALAFLDQVGQTAACNALHSIEQRCARWLLMTHDQVGGDEFLLTHHVLAQMLAVRRAGVTVAASALQRDGLIRYSRGRVTVLDRTGLQVAACECYGVVRANYDRLLGPIGRGAA